MNEDELIDRLRARLSRDDDPRVVIGIGDDAAVLAPAPAGVVVSVDAQVEDVHFRRAWLDLADVAHRGVSAALSDLAAMGSEARAALVSWELPERDGDRALIELVEGLAQASRDYDVPIVGGNVSRGPALSQHTTVIGEATEPPVRRGGARPGDAVYVTGPLGATALGMHSLMDGRDDAFGARFRRPRARMDRRALVASVARACIDISDGLGSELGHLADASGVGFTVDLSAVPTMAGFDELAEELDLDPEDLVVAGGEDYELLFTARDKVPEELATKIGVVTPSGIALRRRDGSRYRGEAGFRHR